MLEEGEPREVIAIIWLSSGDEGVAAACLRLKLPEVAVCEVGVVELVAEVASIEVCRLERSRCPCMAYSQRKSVTVPTKLSFEKMSFLFVCLSTTSLSSFFSAKKHFDGSLSSHLCERFLQSKCHNRALSTVSSSGNVRCAPQVLQYNHGGM